MSRRLPALFMPILLGPVPALAQAGLPQAAPSLPLPGTPDQPTIVTAEEAMAMDRARLHAVLDTECPPSLLDEDVVVCGRRPGFQRYRVPMTGADVSPGTRERAGDAQLYAMEANDQGCSPIGRDNGCGGGIDLIGIGFAIARGIAQALANRD
jgi:hypothetical protein